MSEDHLRQVSRHRFANRALLLEAHADEARERAVDENLEGLVYFLSFGSPKRNLEDEGGGGCQAVLILEMLQFLRAFECQDDVLLQVRVEREFSTRYRLRVGERVLGLVRNQGFCLATPLEVAPIAAFRHPFGLL